MIMKISRAWGIARLVYLGGVTTLQVVPSAVSKFAVKDGWEGVKENIRGEGM